MKKNPHLMYKYANATKCFEVAILMLVYLFEKKTDSPEANRQLEAIIKAMTELNVNAPKVATPP